MLFRSLAVIAADINGLKEANDTFGHEAGDRLITDIASCMVEVFGGKFVFRTGGDEFIAIQQDHSEEECREGIERLREIMKKRGVSAALGYAYSSRYDSGFAELQALADQRMYEDKDRYYRESGRKRR